MEQVKCCFCNKELLNKIDRQNPEPLCCASETVCCPDCNIAYVRPIRRLLWNPSISVVERNILIDSLQGISAKKLQKILAHKDPLSKLRKRAGWRGK